MMDHMISYAQNGEDVILRRIFGDRQSGFYIDIGASHPENLSVTKYFYDLGWHGINVDPIRKSMELFFKDRPRDVNLNVAISSENGSCDFYEVTDYPELSTFSSGQVDAKHSVISYPVKMITGNTLFSEYVTQPVDFMKIDVEGAEYDVISSINFQLYRPKVLVIEATIPDAKFPGWSNFNSIFSYESWDNILLENKYIFAYFDGLNRFYVSEENKDFLKYFQIGLCHWDNYTIASQANRIRELDWHCSERMKQIETLTAMVHKLQKSKFKFSDENSTSEFAKIIKIQKKRISELEWHCEERMKQIDILTQMVQKKQKNG